VILVSGTVHFDPRISPLLGHPVSVLAVDVEGTVARRFALGSLREVDCKVPIPVRERISVILERYLKPRHLEPGN